MRSIRIFSVVIAAMVAIFFSSVTFASVDTTPSLNAKHNKLERTSEKVAREWKDLVVAVGNRLNVRWEKKSGIQLFPMGDKTCWLQGSKKDFKIVLSGSEKLKELTLRVKKEGNEERYYMGVSKQF